MSDRVSAGDEVTEDLYPPGAVEDFLGPLAGVVSSRNSCDTLQLGWDLAVGAGK